MASGKILITAKGDSVPISDDRHFAIKVVFENTGSIVQEEIVEFNNDALGWQYLSDTIIADSAYTSIKFYILYYKNENTAYFDGMQLFKEKFGVSYQYDANGNIISTKDLANKNSEFIYDDYSNLTEVTDAKGNKFSYTYDANHNVETATSAMNVLHSFKYNNSYGNITETIVGVESSDFTKTQATYTASGNYLQTFKDARGKTVVYNWDEVEDELDSVEDSKNNLIYYTYDDLSRLTQVMKNYSENNVTKTASNTYLYENDRIKSVSHNADNNTSVTYHFNYDSFGNTTEVKVGEQLLTTNNYDVNNGKLLSTHYGEMVDVNGTPIAHDKISYGFDHLDRITEILLNDVVKYKYHFNANGMVGYHEDIDNQVEYRYEYDLADRLHRVSTNDGYAISYSYDANNNINNVSETINSKQYDTNYEYDKDNRLTDVTFDHGDGTNNVQYSYDVLGRLTKRTVTNGTTPLNTTKYAFVQGASEYGEMATTSLVKEMTTGNRTYHYSYDDNGNITSITLGTEPTEPNQTITYTYKYNELNELIEEVNPILGKTITYTYDEGGNILSKTETPIGEPIGEPTTITYSYDDANWKDKLTKYGNDQITYDKIGNPLTYAGYTYKWQAGDQLAGISGNGVETSYKYNDGGYRTEKTVNGVKTKYRLEGSKVTYEINGEDEIYYTYDSKLISMNYNGEDYFYVYNLQGDVVGLLDSTGTEVVSYTYDTWGKEDTITGPLADTVGKKNPYRYRGYRYDSETGLYYLNSRYYNPEWGRMLNADSFGGFTGELLSHNVFAYVQNNPVMFSDPTGHYLEHVGYEGEYELSRQEQKQANIYLSLEEDYYNPINSLDPFIRQQLPEDSKMIGGYSEGEIANTGVAVGFGIASYKVGEKLKSPLAGFVGMASIGIGTFVISDNYNASFYFISFDDKYNVYRRYGVLVKFEKHGRNEVPVSVEVFPVGIESNPYGF